VLELKQRSKAAESRLGDKLIETGKLIKEKQQSDPGATQ
jgi:hypothetical protein